MRISKFPPSEMIAHGMALRGLFEIVTKGLHKNMSAFSRES